LLVRSVLSSSGPGPGWRGRRRRSA
jgi:hypothetical protein